MARGVSDNFLQIARREQRLGRRAALAAVLLAPLAGFLAELADTPGYGPVWVWFVVAVLGGLALGLVLARRRLEDYEADLRLRWNHWMHAAVDAHRLGDVARRVREQDPLPSILGALAAAGLFGLNLLLFALLWVEVPWAPTLAWLVVGLDGVVLGGLVTTSALVLRWSREFVRSAESMVQQGELAIWGER